MDRAVRPSRGPGRLWQDDGPSLGTSRRVSRPAPPRTIASRFTGTTCPVPAGRRQRDGETNPGASRRTQPMGQIETVASVKRSRKKGRTSVTPETRLFETQVAVTARAYGGRGVGSSGTSEQGPAGSDLQDSPRTDGRVARGLEKVDRSASQEVRFRGGRSLSEPRVGSVCLDPGAPGLRGLRFARQGPLRLRGTARAATSSRRLRSRSGDHPR